MTELKPCPFCGTDDYGVHLQKIDYIAICRTRWKVICETCGAEVSEYELPERAAEAWNRRCGDENAVPAVRCKDCKHSYEDISGRVCTYGPALECVVEDDFFCGLGERKDGSA